jgi:pyruvate dehydrogenase E2 component (dihydrolipoamide acetyltransferase)
MATKVHMEALSPTMEEGQLVRWLKHEGDAITEGDVLAEIETDKATMELVARGAGVLTAVKLKEGETAPVGEVIALIAAEGETAEAEADAGGATDSEAAGAPADSEDAAPADSEDAAPADSEDAAPADSEDASSAGRDAAQASEASGRPERQERATPAAEGTGSADTAAEATPKEAGGRAAESGKRAAARGGEEQDGDAAGSEGDRGGEDKERGAGRAQSGDGAAGRVKASPLAKRLAAESGVDLAAVEGTGPGGRITKRDIEAALSEPAAEAADARAARDRDAVGGEEAASEDEAERAPAGVAAHRAGDERAATGDERAAAERERAPAAAAAADAEEVPVSQMRKAIAKRLAQSNGPVPTFFLTVELDMTRMLELREQVNRRLEADGVKASLNDFLIKAVAAALAQHPEVNASWGDSVIVRHRSVHIGVAVAIEDGLITPVVRDADRKRVRDIAVEVRELAGRAREKKLKPDEYTGATFSISNLGMFGITEFTAIINPPESGIIAVGAVEEKPVVEDGAVVVRPRMRLTMSCDHRVVDGAMGARFLQTVREMVEEPVFMVA